MAPKDVAELLLNLDILQNPLFISGEPVAFNAKLQWELARKDVFSKTIMHLDRNKIMNATTIILADKLNTMANFHKILNESFFNKPGIGKVLVGQNYPILIIYNTSQEVKAIMKAPPIKINQMIFFLNITSQLLIEMYNINGYIVTNQVGKFVKSRTKFSSNSRINNLIARRSDFHGQTLIAVVEKQLPFNVFETGFENKAKFYPENSTYEIRGFTSGLFFEVLQLLEKELNFTAMVYKRKDSVWGGPDPKLPTGWNGMVSNLLDNSADIIVGSLTMTSTRFEAVDYLIPIGMETYAIFIKAVDNEDISWQTYGKPLKRYTWMALVLLAVVFASFIFIIDKRKESLTKAKQQVCTAIHSKLKGN